ncbi:hypothetical protein ACFY2K_26245 [Kitasatospora sp. NPDC001309]|uniref:hypothetical protein n=1 Tax=Kitasatospora sp. NPDC001309 TaxID=3364013 RepID=UPI0036A91DA5
MGDEEDSSSATNVRLRIYSGRQAGPTDPAPLLDQAATYEAPAWVCRWTPGALGEYVAYWIHDTGYRRLFFEVTESPIVSVKDVRAFDDVLADSIRYPSALIAAARDVVEEEFERITERSFVMRARILSAGIDPQERENDISRQTVSPDGSTYFEFGIYPPPADVRRAALLRIRDLLVSANTAIPDRAVSFQISDMGTYQLATAGRAGFETGLPEVDAILNRYKLERWAI